MQYEMFIDKEFAANEVRYFKIIKTQESGAYQNQTNGPS